MFRADVLTLFPQCFPGVLGDSVIGRALERKIAEVNPIDLRSFATDARGTVDDRPYGGGPGMLMLPDICVRAVESVRKSDSFVILTSPRGKLFTQQEALKLSKLDHLVIVAPHYEGVDQRAIDEVVDCEYSLGDYVLTGGDLAAMVILDAVIRLLPGALGDDESSVDESHACGLLEYSQYTRPPLFRNRAVPEVLLSGDHKKVSEYRRIESEMITRERRPDIWKKYLLEESNHGKLKIR